jgi:HEAT repeat protein
MPLPTLLVIIVLATGELASFELGPSLDPDLTPDMRIQFILADFDARTDLLWEMDPTTASQALVDRLQRGSLSPNDLIHVIQALGIVGRPLGAPAVEKFITHPELSIRIAAIRSLGQMGRFSDIPLIELDLNDANPEVRRTALIALGKFGKLELIPKLEDAARREPALFPLAQDAKRRTTALAAKNFPAFVDAVIPTDEYDDLLPLLMVTWQPLVELLSQKDRGPVVRRRAVRLISLGRVRKASPKLTAIVADRQEPPELRLEAVIALGRCRLRSSREQLIALLNSPEPFFQDAAITSLGQLGVPEALDPLLKKWNDRGGALRERIRLAVRRSSSVSGSDLLAGLLANDSALSYKTIIVMDSSLNLTESFRVELVEPWLMNPSSVVRRDAALLLAFLGRRADAPKLERMRSDPEPANRELAERALRRLRSSAVE